MTKLKDAYFSLAVGVLTIALLAFVFTGHSQMDAAFKGHNDWSESASLACKARDVGGYVSCLRWASQYDPCPVHPNAFTK